jgi:hypothetical protein
LPFAFGGFLLGCVVPSRFGDAVFGVSLLGLVLLADAVVVQARGRRFVRWFACVAFVPTTLVCVTTVLMLAVVKEGMPTHASFLWLLVAGLVGSLVLTRRQPTLTMFAPVACATAAEFALGASHEFFPAIAIAISACLLPCIRVSSWRARLTLLGAAGVSAIAISGSLTLLRHLYVHSIWGALLAGLVAGLVGLLAWHSVLAMRLMLRLEQGCWRTAFGNAASDVAPFVFAGLVGASSGWALLHSNLSASGALLAVGVGIALIAARPTKMVSPEPNLEDDDLLDVLQSALLDLPASRLPEE